MAKLLSDRDERRLSNVVQAFERQFAGRAVRPSQTPRQAATKNRQAMKLAVTNEDIVADDTGAVTVWDHTQTVPVVTAEVIDDVALDWMHGGQQVSSGKQVVIVTFDGVLWRILLAECEGDTEPASKVAVGTSTEKPTGDTTLAAFIEVDTATKEFKIFYNEGAGVGLVEYEQQTAPGA